ncbi:DUF2752 domain-containing protein [Pontibacter korlensis]|uniref:DUF2752 domain-containing protein n=1 Tax=Pontibacter korlensis TaxID=400092 RepID=UPI0008FFA758|nr:DUF2752 domain-containing protein [Pontibacter korlensis]
MKLFLTPNKAWGLVRAWVPLEAVLWLLGLSLLALMDPHEAHLFSFCPFSWMLDTGCPGCGLGHGIAYLARGDWPAMWASHPLAVPAVVLLLWRCGKLLYFHRKYDHQLYTKKNYGKYPPSDAGPGAR